MSTEDSQTFQSGGEVGGGTVAVSVVVGLVGVLLIMVVMWRLRGCCCRQLELRVVVEAERTVLYRFLSDPHNLKIVHPYTTEIRVVRETKEEGGVVVTEFDWVEKVPFTVLSSVRMSCDPSTFTIRMDIVPAGGFQEVQLTWQLKPTGESPENCEETQLASQPTLPESSAQTTGNDNRGLENVPNKTDNRRSTTPSICTDKKNIYVNSPVNSEASTVAKESQTTEFHNRIQVTGSNVLVVVLPCKIIEYTEKKLMERLRQHFKNSAK